MVTFVTRCELATATSMLLLAHRRYRFRARRTRWLQERAAVQEDYNKDGYMMVLIPHEGEA